MKLFYAELQKIKNSTNSPDQTNPSSDIKELFSRLLFDFSKNLTEALPWITRKMREFACINCWHMNDYESDAMWRLYLKSNEGIAVQTTMGKLNTCFGDQRNNLLIGEVRYVDYEQASFMENIYLEPFMHKRISFAHENEVRAILFSNQSNFHYEQWKVFTDLLVNYFAKFVEPKEQVPELLPHNFGTNVTVDLDILIDKVYVSPTSPDWIYELVLSILKKYNLQKEVVRSSLSEQPAFFRHL